VEIQEWQQHVEDIKRYSIEKERDYASHWTNGRTIIVIKGLLFVRPLRYSIMLTIQMTDLEIREVSETPGIPFFEIHPVYKHK
jgi:hypothetical protein